MKKIVVTAFVLLCAVTLSAQVYMADVLKPSQEYRLSISNSKAGDRYYSGPHKDSFRFCNIFKMNGGIKIIGATGGLIDGDDHGYAVFKLDKKYAKMSFWLGSGNWHGGVETKSLLIIHADKKKIFDRPVFHCHEPEFVVLDISDADSLLFKISKIGGVDVVLGQLQLWEEGETVVEPPFPYTIPEGKVKLVEQLTPYFTQGSVDRIHPDAVKSISIDRHTFKSGIQLKSYEEFIGSSSGDMFFWLRKRFEKISFIVGPRDNKSTNSSAWLVIYGDKNKILYEEVVRQTDLPQQVVLDVSGQERIRFSCELRGTANEFSGGITFGVVDLYAYPEEVLAEVPVEGLVNLNKSEISRLPSPCPLMSSIQPYSMRGYANADAVRFEGESDYITFSMGGEKFTEGLILTTGKELLGDQVEAYISFDVAGEFDYISFYAGMLSKHRVLDDDKMLIFADDSLVFDEMIHCTWPNQYFEVPIHKCRILKFAKRGNANKDRQCYIGVGDITLYRGTPVQHDLFSHARPECPDEADLIDLCGKPYFHYVGRFLSSLTNFDFNECFNNGETKRRYFRMKDGSQIFKGVMLEANMPIGLENVTLTDAFLMFFVGAGSAISSSSMSAYTGVSAGGGLAGQMGILHLMNNRSGGQASVVSFNPYGEYKSCTFTVANKSEYWDDMDQLLNLGERVDHPFKLNIFANQRLVGELWLTNKMEPVTMTVPIFNCNALTFWLEPGDTRSGQFVLYDMKVSKAPCDIPVPDGYHTEPQVPEPQKSMQDQAGDMLNKALDKVNEAVENVNEILTPTDSIVTSPEGRPGEVSSPEGRPGEVVETGGTLPPPVWSEE